MEHYLLSRIIQEGLANNFLLPDFHCSLSTVLEKSKCNCKREPFFMIMPPCFPADTSILVLITRIRDNPDVIELERQPDNSGRKRASFEQFFFSAVFLSTCQHKHHRTDTSRECFHYQLAIICQSTEEYSPTLPSETPPVLPSPTHIIDFTQCMSILATIGFSS